MLMQVAPAPPPSSCWTLAAWASTHLVALAFSGSNGHTQNHTQRGHTEGPSPACNQPADTHFLPLVCLGQMPRMTVAASPRGLLPPDHPARWGLSPVYAQIAAKVASCLSIYCGRGGWVLTHVASRPTLHVACAVLVSSFCRQDVRPPRSREGTACVLARGRACRLATSEGVALSLAERAEQKSRRMRLPSMPATGWRRGNRTCA